MTVHPLRAFRVDLHVHTRRHSPCAELLDPMQLDETMDRAGLDGLVLCEHDRYWDDEEFAQLAASLTGGRRIYRGIELSSRDGHFLVVGPRALTAITRGMSARTVVAAARRVGAAVVLAHPQRKASVNATPPAKLPAGIDAVEVYSSITRDEATERAEELATWRDWGRVGGSDAHALEVVGAAYTEFPFLPRDEEALARAIIDRLGKPRRRSAASRPMEQNLDNTMRSLAARG